MKPVVAEIKRLEELRADLGTIVASAVEKSVGKAFSEMLKKLGK